MARPVVHVEITGRDPAALRGRLIELFGSHFAAPATVAEGDVVGVAALPG
jgi:hypothetical protein